MHILFIAFELKKKWTDLSFISLLLSFVLVAFQAIRNITISFQKSLCIQVYVICLFGCFSIKWKNNKYLINNNKMEVNACIISANSILFSFSLAHHSLQSWHWMIFNWKFAGIFHFKLIVSACKHKLPVQFYSLVSFQAPQSKAINLKNVQLNIIGRERKRTNRKWRKLNKRNLKLAIKEEH